MILDIQLRIGDNPVLRRVYLKCSTKKMQIGDSSVLRWVYYLYINWIPLVIKRYLKFGDSSVLRSVYYLYICTAPLPSLDIFFEPLDPGWGPCKPRWNTWAHPGNGAYEHGTLCSGCERLYITLRKGLSISFIAISDIRHLRRLCWISLDLKRA